MTAASNKYELPGVTDLVRGFLLNSSVNRVPRPLHVCILYELVPVIRIHINADGMHGQGRCTSATGFFSLEGNSEETFL